MTHLSRTEFEEIVTLYLDGELAQDEVARFEAYLAENSFAAKEFDELKNIKLSLKERKPIEKNDWFWIKLNHRIAEHEQKQRNPFLRYRSTYALSITLVLTTFVIGTIYFKDADLFKNFFLKKKAQVENSLLSGTILPFFTNLDKDKVLQFALFGNLSLDSNHTTELQVKNEAEKGARIEIASLAEPRMSDVSLQNFVSEVGMTKSQQQTVDSLLEKCTERLQASVLIDEHKRLAINEELANLNKVMVSTIAASLEPQQRVKFQNFLEKRNAPYTVVALNTPAALPNTVLRHMAAVPRSKKFVVISPDSVSFAELRFNLDSIREMTKNVVRENQRERSITLNVVRDMLSKQKMLVEAQSLNAEYPVRVTQSGDAFQIHFEPGIASMPPISDFSAVEIVRPRTYSTHLPKMNRVPNNVIVEDDSSVLFELRADSAAVKILKSLTQKGFQFEFSDSMAMYSPTVRLRITPNQRKRIEQRAFEQNKRKKNEDLIDLDSLLEESNKQNSIDSNNQKIKSKVMDL